MPEKVESWADYQAGYRTAICDLIPDPNARRQNDGLTVYLAYFIGLVVGALIYKYTRE